MGKTGKNAWASGLTLIEMLITLSILSIVIFSGTEYITTFYSKTTLKSERDKLWRAIILTRQEAIRRATLVTLCKSDNGTSCNTNTNTNWNVGWIVQITKTQANNQPSTEILRVKQAASHGVSITSSRNAITYGPEGHLAMVANTTFRICANNVNELRIVINRIGRPKMVEGDKC